MFKSLRPFLEKISRVSVDHPAQTVPGITQTLSTRAIAFEINTVIILELIKPTCKSYNFIVAVTRHRDMSSIEGQPEPREFIYLNEQSINGHLSSMGVGIETGAQKSQKSESEQEGRLRAILPLFGGAVDGEAKHRQLSSEDFQQQINLTAPYRFARLKEEFRSAGIDIKNPFEQGVSSGDVVEITGTIEAMSLFRIEIHEEAVASLGEAFSALRTRWMRTPKQTMIC